jgi:hypothetical protein
MKYTVRPFFTPVPVGEALEFALVVEEELHAASSAAAVMTLTAAVIPLVDRRN